MNEPGLGFMERSWMPSAIRVLSSQAREGRWRTHRQKMEKPCNLCGGGNIHRKPVRLRRAEDQVSHVRAHTVTSGAQEAVTTNTSAVEGNKCTSFLHSLRHLRGGLSAG